MTVRSRWIPPNRNAQHPLGQRRQMLELFPQFKSEVLRDGGVEWTGVLRPTSDSPAYTIRIVHAVDRSPKVFVSRPRLAAGAPHIYSDGSLCLYWPDEWRWRASDSIAETMVPWTAIWLYHYEVWLITGEWLGPSSPHSLRPNK